MPFSSWEPAKAISAIGRRKDLLTFVHDDGKGFIAAHTGDDAFLHLARIRRGEKT